MYFEEIDGERQLDFVRKFDYIREAGTEGEQKAAASIQEELRSFGLESRLEEFPFEAFEIEEARFFITEPFEKEYVVTGYGKCGQYPGGRRGGSLPLCGERRRYQPWLCHRKDRDGKRSGPQRFIRETGQAGAVAYLSISGAPIDEGEDLKPALYSLPSMKETPIQGVCIHHRDAVDLVSRGASRAKLVLKQKLVERISANVAARITGTEKPDEILTLTAHYDSVPAGPGAYDNISGGAIIMELCRYFNAHRPKRTMEFIWFGAEEKGLLGSQEYVRAHASELPSHQFNMNVDLAGQLVGGTVVGVTADPAICQMITYMAHEIGLGMRTSNAIWGSDSNTFAWKGIPAMTLNRDGFGMHTRHDTVDLISSWSLKRSAMLLGYIADRLGNLPTFPFPKEIPAEFMEQLDKYFNR